MKKKLFRLALLVSFVCALLIAGASADAIELEQPIGGSGTAADPYQIASAAELYWFARHVNAGRYDACAMLVDEITVNEQVLTESGELVSDTDSLHRWTAICNVSGSYTGTFNGNGHTISGLYCVGSHAEYIGLFGRVGNGGVVKDVIIEDSYFEGVYSAGGVCNQNAGEMNKCSFSGIVKTSATGAPSVGGVCAVNSGNIIQCESSAAVTSRGNYGRAGGVCGENSGTVSYCYNTGSVTSNDGDDNLGGVCGQNSGTIENCYNEGNVSGYGYNGTASGSTTGGVCGNNSGSITNCYNTGNVHESLYTGGVCGNNRGSITSSYNTGSVAAGTRGYAGGVCGANSSTVTHCYNTGSISGSNVGGVCGENSGTITNCYWLEGTASAGIGNGSGEATSKTSDEFKSGEVTWLLNDGNGPWRQTLGEGGDAEPVLDATHGEVICIYIDNTPVYANPGSVTLPDPEPGKAYFDETGKYVDPETYKFTDGMRIHLEDAITASFVYGDGTSVTQMVKEDISSVVMPEAPTRPGCIFMGWRSGDMTYEPGDEVGLYGDTTFTAVWANMPDITPSEPEALPFTDVPEGAWYYDAVKTVVEAGLMKGVSDTDFAPNGILNRAMFWTLLARAGGIDTDGGETWYYKAQAWAVENGVSDGADAMGALTREQLVTMLWRLNGEPVVNYLITAPNAADISSWALEAMRWAASTGLIQGDDAGALTPAATCTRAQAATFLVRYLSVA